MKTPQAAPRRTGLALVLSCLLLIPACTDPETYPVSGEKCGPDDPVRTLDARDCVPPV